MEFVFMTEISKYLILAIIKRYRNSTKLLFMKKIIWYFKLNVGAQNKKIERKKEEVWQESC